MNHQTSAQQLIRKPVYGLVQRLLHAAIALAVVLLFASAWATKLFEPGLERAALWRVHILLGETLGVLVVGRLVWGLLGPASARFHWPRIKRRDFTLALPKEFGHAPLTALGYQLLYLTLGFLCLSGLVLAGARHGEGPLGAWLFDQLEWEAWLSSPHSAAAYAVLAFIPIHLGAMVWHETRDGLPIVQSMISGYQYRESKEEKPNEKESP